MHYAELRMHYAQHCIHSPFVTCKLANSAQISEHLVSGSVACSGAGGSSESKGNKKHDEVDTWDDDEDITASNEVFRTWAHTAECRARVLRVRSIGALQRIVRAHSRDPARGALRVAGTGHSPSRLVCASTIVKLALTRIDVDVRARSVWAQGGATLADIGRACAVHRLALPVLGAINAQTCAGAVMTATHGTGHPCLSAYLLALELLDAQGTLHHIDRTHPWYAAACVSLGALGIVTAVQLQCVPAHRLHARQYRVKLRELTPQPDAHELYRFWWIPHTDDAIVWHAQHSEREVMHRSTMVHRLTSSKAFSYHTLEALLAIATAVPSLVVPTNRAYNALLLSQPWESVDESEKLLNYDCLFRQYVSEWAVPAERCMEALERLRKMIDANAYKVHFPVEVRFVKRDELWLSPAYQRDICYIGIIMYKPYGIKQIPMQKEYFLQFEKIMSELDGRPHWAKDFSWTSEDFARSYPRFRDFQALRDKLDPNRIFANDLIRQIFGE